MPGKDLPSPELLRKLLRYDPETGKLFWRERVADCPEHRRWNTRYARKEAGKINSSDGYMRVKISCRLMKAHRVVWAMQTGDWPVGQIDHVNHDRADNRINNLRCVTVAENSRNQSIASNNTSGVCGVYWHRSTGKWRAVISVSGVRLYLGDFSNLFDATTARRASERKYGYHENHGA